MASETKEMLWRMQSMLATVRGEMFQCRTREELASKVLTANIYLRQFERVHKALRGEYRRWDRLAGDEKTWISARLSGGMGASAVPESVIQKFTARQRQAAILRRSEETEKLERPERPEMPNISERPKWTETTERPEWTERPRWLERSEWSKRPKGAYVTSREETPLTSTPSHDTTPWWVTEGIHKSGGRSRREAVQISPIVDQGVNTITRMSK